ncbi:BMP family ABC transporter substrate-binding protein [Arsenicitalea aurantiaca]|uniref:BMP family ABC transporter substrate-binding protein n=1 Tax=Arsenicitalea aurantiaca TaxID=1783274 RepID=A0A433X3Y0_9HYPH|nr:BMP family ABC transporter substrate-binding protein [Arsenicitalea aurantiaca]RUT28762.1 BMP family ABC transporter substrate-binding protein [Arsenicitalea aurantiaca]
MTKTFTRSAIALAAGAGMAALMAGTALADPAVLYDGGGKFDASFNESTFNGAQRFSEETGIGFGEFEITTDAQREQAMRQFAQRGANPILVPGFNWETTIRTVAAEFPDTNFAIIDAVVDLPNVRSIVFKEHEGSYLVGILAAMASETGTIGVVPAFDFALLNAFACGYKQGAKSVNPDIEILDTYIGSGFDAFNNPGGGAEVAQSQLDRGADVIFQVAGGAGQGVLQAVADADKLGIGVDSNQNHLHPGNVLTSMLKRVDVATYNAFKDFEDGNWTNEIITLGVAEEGVGPAFDEHNEALITDEMRAAVDEATAKITSGEIVVHDFRTDNSCPV